MKRYILYKLRKKPNGKVDKIPHSPISGRECGNNNPAHWVNLADALRAKGRYGLDGIGRIFHENHKEVFLDIDHAVTSKGTWSPEAIRMMRMCRGMESELSQSGNGLHFFGPYRGEAPEHRSEVDKGNDHFGLYHKGRYAALTFQGVTQPVPTDQTDCFHSLVKEYFQPKYSTGGEGLQGPGNDLSPEEIIGKACRDKRNPFASNNFKRLWDGDPKVIEEQYEGDRSSADAALTQHLAFWTGKDPDKIREMLLMSGLKRDKWENHRTYLDLTINNALARQEECYTTQPSVQERCVPPSPEPAPPLKKGEWPSAQFIETYPLCTPAQQMELFKGCVYVAQRHQVFSMGSGLFMSPEQFKAYYGNREYAMDNRSHKFVTNAWEAFINSRAVKFPRVQDTCFKPSQKCGSITVQENIEYINVYKELDIPCEKGDVGKFLKHLGLLLPDARDRGILLAFMAACVQYKGRKFQWAPVVQGVQGNGKTFLTRVLEYCVGKRYVHRPTPEDLSAAFNGWLENKLLISVEEMKVKQGVNLMESLKTLITSFDGFPVKAKFQNAKQVDLTCNFFFTSNHRNAILQTKNERRYAVFFTAQQEFEDLKKSGMTGEYFSGLYEWAKNGGYSHTHHYLKNYNIPIELDPSKGAQRAPRTSSLDEAVLASESLSQKLIREAIESEKRGFRGGYVSSLAVKLMLKEEGKKITNHAISEILKNLGYKNHGRASRALDVDRGERPIIYARRTELDPNYTQNYENSQKGLDTSLST